ncbi:MAG: hypothetical protein HOC23_07995 [Halieaceae bacterium]|jgi:hypothetical protein|nr:hypothetical protein [Halieaceae bacterium]
MTKDVISRVTAVSSWTSLTADQQIRFDAWVHSPSVFSSDTDELIIAFKLGRIFPYPASRILKALRGVEGLDPAMVGDIESYVMAEPALVFSGEPPSRLVALTRYTGN